jgi:Holliday junction resolvase RusA-like endonuclease
VNGARSGTTWRVVLEERDLPVFAVQKGGPRKHRLPRKNRYFVVNHHTKSISTRTGIRNALAKSIIAVSWETNAAAPPRFRSALSLHLVQFSPKRHATGIAAGLPLLDSDACIAAVRDALQHAGIVENDALIVRNVCECRYRKDEPGLEIEVTVL